MKAKTIFTLLLAWMMAAGAMAEKRDVLAVNMKDGSKVHFVLKEQHPTVRCSHGIMQVNYISNNGATYMAFGRDEVESLEVMTAEPADVNGDGTVDVADISTIISIMAGAGTASVSADVNGDGQVDVADISTVISEMAARARTVRR